MYLKKNADLRLLQVNKNTVKSWLSEEETRWVVRRLDSNIKIILTLDIEGQK